MTIVDSPFQQKNANFKKFGEKWETKSELNNFVGTKNLYIQYTHMYVCMYV